MHVVQYDKVHADKTNEQLDDAIQDKFGSRKIYSKRSGHLEGTSLGKREEPKDNL